MDEKLEVDYQIGEDFKEKARFVSIWQGNLISYLRTQIIPRAVDYFTGKALEFEVMDSDDEFEDIDDEDEDGYVFDDSVRFSVPSHFDVTQVYRSGRR